MCLYMFSQIFCSFVLEPDNLGVVCKCDIPNFRHYFNILCRCFFFLLFVSSCTHQETSEFPSVAPFRWLVASWTTHWVIYTAQQSTLTNTFLDNNHSSRVYECGQTSCKLDHTGSSTLPNKDLTSNTSLTTTIAQ